MKKRKITQQNLREFLSIDEFACAVKEANMSKH